MPPSPPSDRQLEALFRSLAEAESAGVSPTTYLDSRAAELSLNATLRAALRSAVRRGRDLSDALRDTGLLDASEAALLRAGEKSGQLQESFAALADAAAQRRRTRNKLLLGLAYPAVLVAAAGLILPLPVVFTDGFGAYLALAVWAPATMAVGAALVLWVWPRLPRSSPVRTAPLALAMATPILGAALRRGHCGTFARILGRSLAAGLPMREALRLGLGASGSDPLRSATDGILRSLDEGATLTDALESTGHFSRPFLSEVRHGELTGTLDATMDRLADREQGAGRRAAVGLVVVVIVLVIIAVTIAIGAFVVTGVQDYLDTIDSAIEQNT